MRILDSATDRIVGGQAHGLISFAYETVSWLVGCTCSIGARTVVQAATVLNQEAHGQYVEDAKIQPHIWVDHTNRIQESRTQAL